MDATDISPVPYRPPTYFWHWMAIVLPLVTGLFIWPVVRSMREPDRFALPNSGDSDWYLVLKMPEVTKEDEIAPMKERAIQWLSGLERAGYQPILLSDAVTRLQ